MRGAAQCVALLLAAWASAWAAPAAEQADSLVGKSVLVKNVYRNSGGVTISKLRTESEVEPASRALQAALKKYPASFIERVLSTVYVGSELRWTSNKDRDTDGWLGLYRYQDRAMFLKYDGDAAVFERVFHHELAHGIHFAFRTAFNERAWQAENPAGFAYTGAADPGPPTPELLQKGFVRPYAMYSLAEDVACLAECLIGDPQGFAKGMGRYERIGRKARLLIALYQTVDPVMTVGYFRLQQEQAREEAEEESMAGERGRPLVVSSLSERGAFVGNVKAGDRVTLLYRDAARPRSTSSVTFEPKSPANVVLCRRRKGREEPELTVLAKVPRLTRDDAYSYTFKEDCAAVLAMSGEDPDGATRARFEFQLERSGRR